MAILAAHSLLGVEVMAPIASGPANTLDIVVFAWLMLTVLAGCARGIRNIIAERARA